MTERSEIVERWRQEETEKHEAWLTILKQNYQRQLKDAQRAHAKKLRRLDRIEQGEQIPGFCYACMSDFRTFYQWDGYEQCPRCGAEWAGGAEG